MAETPSKRPREEETTLVDNEEEIRGLKRQKSYNDIVLSLLDEVDGDDEPEPEFHEDMSAIFTTLQRELSSDSVAFDDPLSIPDPEGDNPVSDPSPTGSTKADEEEEREKVMRHLLEASDDELGLPNIYGGDEEVDVMNGGDLLPFGNGLWELEDEAANYYTLLQSELFM